MHELLLAEAFIVVALEREQLLKVWLAVQPTIERRVVSERQHLQREPTDPSIEQQVVVFHAMNEWQGGSV